MGMSSADQYFRNSALRAGFLLLRLSAFEFAKFSFLLAHVFGEHADDRERLTVDVDDFAKRNNLAPGFQRTP